MFIYMYMYSRYKLQNVKVGCSTYNDATINAVFVMYMYMYVY